MPRPSTREKILDCAEQLFGDHGLDGVSLRAINANAGLSPAALHYHFGSQQALVEALLERRMPALMARRAALLETLEARSGSVIARDVLEALMIPLVELLESDGLAGLRYLRFIHRLQTDGAIDPRFVIDRWRGGVEGLLPLFRRALPDLPISILKLRVDLASHTMLSSLARRSTVYGETIEPQAGALLDFLTGGLEAAASDPPPSPAR